MTFQALLKNLFNPTGIRLNPLQQTKKQPVQWQTGSDLATDSSSMSSDEKNPVWKDKSV